MTAFLITLNQLAILAILLLVGYVIKRKNFINDTTISGLSFILLNICMPTVLFSSLQLDFTEQRLVDGVIMIFATMGIMLFGFLIAHLLSIPLKMKKDEKHVFLASGILFNALFIGLPIVKALFGDEAVFYLCIGNVGFNLISFTLVVGIFSGDSKKTISEIIKKIIKTPTIIACVLGFIAFASQIHIPDVILTSFKDLGAMTSPLSMLIMGALVSKSSMKEIFLKKTGYIAAIMRLVIIPLLVLVITKPLIHDDIVRKTLVLTSAMPIATSVSVFAEHYANLGKEASQNCVLSTILSLIMLPLISLIVSVY